MSLSTVRVQLGERSYDIVIGWKFLSRATLPTQRLGHPDRTVVVSDENVRPHAEQVVSQLTAEGLAACLIILPPGEAQKCLASAAQLYDRFADWGVDRRTVVIAVGGGVIGDLAGFVAATFHRGLPLLMVPTTLLAMVDSSVGGKVGVNHPRGKNLIGAFHQPLGVWIDVATLDTLPDREFRSGLAEVVKYGVILDADFFAYLENHVEAVLQREPETLQHVITVCCRLKAQIVQQDEREETGLRAVLNYGHTFAHAFETVGGYGNWLHGEAVAAGMVCASRLAELLGRIPSELTQRQVNLLQRFGLPTAAKAWPADELLRAMRSDKKTRAGRLRFVLPKRIGQVELVDGVSEADVRRVLGESCLSR